VKSVVLQGDVISANADSHPEIIAITHLLALEGATMCSRTGSRTAALAYFIML
jgi:hypothetical protein